MKVNLHTHSNLCDGKNSLEEMVISAIDSKFDVIGFSGHGYTDYDESYCMSKENTLVYRQSIASLKEKYKDEIAIFCGIEQDYYSNEPASDYDYVIGSVHSVLKNGEYLYVDWDIDTIKEGIEKHYQGDSLSMAEDYFSIVGDVKNKTGCQIVGHFDLLTKFNEKEAIFDEDSPRYKNALEKALDKLIPQDVIFEINTGAMTRFYRTSPYPSKYILERIKAKGGKITISSDCHSVGTLDYGFDIASKLAKECGFKNISVLNKDKKWIEIPL